MTHGDKAKGKKAASKASGSQKSSKAVKASQVAKSGKNGKKAVQAGPKAEAQKQQSGGKAAAPAKAVAKAVAKAGGSNGKPKARGPEPGGFTNPVIGSAFKRAVKKFPNAFRRLTD